jgi:hypothetical protein
MKKLLIIMLVLMLWAALLGGCASPSFYSSTASAPSASSSSIASAPSSSSIPTTLPDTPVEASASPGDQDDESKFITYNGWTYYLDENDAVVADYGEDPPLHMKKTDNSSDLNLGIRGFDFDITGNYIYVDSNDPDLVANGPRTWSTTRLNLDGSGKKELEYGSMSVRLVPEGEQYFYFTTMGDSAIYISDFSCENVTTLAVNLPDKSQIDGNLSNDKALQLDINDVTNGWIDFDATFSSREGVELYSGSYKITADGKTIEKIKGTYFNYDSQENE